MRAADAGALPKEGAARLYMPAGARGPILLVTHNFDVIKTYNNSNAYVLAVGLLGDAIVGRGPLQDALAGEEHALTRAELKTVQTQLKIAAASRSATSTAAPGRSSNRRSAPISSSTG